MTQDTITQIESQAQERAASQGFSLLKLSGKLHFHLQNSPAGPRNQLFTVTQRDFILISDNEGIYSKAGEVCNSGLNYFSVLLQV